jgi:hypothetical protein
MGIIAGTYLAIGYAVTTFYRYKIRPFELDGYGQEKRKKQYIPIQVWEWLLFIIFWIIPLWFSLVPALKKRI